MTDDQDDIPLDDKDPHAEIVRRAHSRWKKSHKWEGEARDHWLSDLKFAHGDGYNNFQWPGAIYQTRGNRPTLTVNETRQHNLHIKNEAKQNKAQVQYRPIGEGATAASAEIYEGIYRHIQNISNGQMKQGVAIGFQVDAGLGFTVIRSKYTDNKSFDQDIFIEAPANPLNVLLDCDAVEIDGSDARYGFIFADRPRDEMETKYPELKGRGTTANSVDGQDGGWLREDHVREAEYYEVQEDHDELLGDNDGTTVFKSMVPASLIKQWEAKAEAGGYELKRRPVVRKSVKWYKIVGDMVVDETDIPGTSVPIVPWVGEVTVIDQKLDRKGHTRCMLGPQQMVNYNWSASVEYGALQSKTPWVAPVAAISDNMTYWTTANTENHAFLPYTHISEDGNVIPTPTRQDPPSSAPAYLDGVNMARQFMASASGQFEAEMGAPGNERSGKAINERQRQGDRATYHFIDNQAIAIRRQGEIIKEWIPVIYDTARVLRIIGEDGTESHVQIDPQAAQAHQEIEGEVAAIFNPAVGKYEVVSDVGPDYATQRQEAFNAIVQILTQAPQLIGTIGDLLFKVADFPMADQIAERLKPGLPPEAQQAVSTLQAQLKNQNRLLGEAMQALTEERLRLKAKDADDTIKAFDADTKRLSVIKDMIPMDPADMQRLIHTTVHQALQDNLGPVLGKLLGNVTNDDNPAGQDATGEMPIRMPDVGQQAATPGGI
jgi:hypothetical protein